MNSIEGTAAEGVLRVPGERLRAWQVPGRWLLARPGKRVLRPGEICRTREISGALGIERLGQVVDSVRIRRGGPCKQGRLPRGSPIKPCGAATARATGGGYASEATEAQRCGFLRGRRDLRRPCW